MADVGGLFIEARLTEMRIKIPLKKTPAAYAKRGPCRFNAAPTCVANLPFVRGFE
jgi:hypothetical protein